VRKLDWFPLFIHRIKGSKRWKEMRDYQRGQYMSLLIELADSVKLGYLPNDIEGLAKLAGADHMRRAFVQAWIEGGIVRTCFKTRTVDGVEWIYNEPLLEVIENQLKKTKGGRPRNETPLFSLDSDVVLSIYKEYPRKENKRKSLEEIARAIDRYAASEGIEKLDAAEFIHKATIEFQDSDAAKAVNADGRSLCPYPSTWYHNDRFLDDRTQWFWEQKANGHEIKKGPCTKHPGSGLTPKGNCWTCAYGETANDEA
jgi:hypothetical protein